MMISELVKRDDKQLLQGLAKLGLGLDFNKDGTTKVYALKERNESINDDVQLQGVDGHKARKIKS